MKKVFIITFFLFAFSLLIPNISLAGCTTSLGYCPVGQVGCSTNKTKIGITNCCDSSADCTQLWEEVQAQRATERSNNDIHGGCGETGINTAIGCINVLGSQEEFLGQILKWSIGVGGGIAFLLIVYASFMIMTSGGNPERLKAGQELLTSAISGLILLVLSIFVLKFIGIDILGLDRFGFGSPQ